MAVRRRIRVELPDRPGALAQVTGRLAEWGADVLSVDIHTLDDRASSDLGAPLLAVDEILVEVAESWDAAEFASALAGAGAGRVLGVTTSGPGADRVVAALQWARHLVETGVHSSELELAGTIAQLCTSSTAWVGAVEVAATEPLVAEALGAGRSIVRRMQLVPARLRMSDQEEAYVVAVPDDSTQPRRVALVARAASMPFTLTEIARIEALLGLAHELSFAR
jgi:ACT domain